MLFIFCEFQTCITTFFRRQCFRWNKVGFFFITLKKMTQEQHIIHNFKCILILSHHLISSYTLNYIISYSLGWDIFVLFYFVGFVWFFMGFASCANTIWMGEVSVGYVLFLIFLKVCERLLRITKKHPAVFEIRVYQLHERGITTCSICTLHP